MIQREEQLGGTAEIQADNEMAPGLEAWEGAQI